MNPYLKDFKEFWDETKNDWIAERSNQKSLLKNDVETGASNKANDLGLDEKEFAFFEVIQSIKDDANEFKLKEEEATYISNKTMEICKEIAKDEKLWLKIITLLIG